jgi:hypothetical protein
MKRILLVLILATMFFTVTNKTTFADTLFDATLGNAAEWKGYEGAIIKIEAYKEGNHAHVKMDHVSLPVLFFILNPLPSQFAVGNRVRVDNEGKLIPIQ